MLYLLFKSSTDQFIPLISCQINPNTVTISLIHMQNVNRIGRQRTHNLFLYLLSIHNPFDALTHIHLAHRFANTIFTHWMEAVQKATQRDNWGQCHQTDAIYVLFILCSTISI